MTPTVPAGDRLAQLETRLYKARAERDRIAREIADEAAAGEWVPGGLLRDYRAARQRTDGLDRAVNGFRPVQERNLGTVR